MLSKSAARRFFILGTFLFSAIFLALTVDTVRQIPERTNEDQLSASVVRGKVIWEDNNCMGCHTIMGEGAYYAPELTKVIERRGAAWIKVFMKDTQAMYPGRRKMVQYDFTDEQLDDVIAFLAWVGKMDLNGFPKKPYLQQSEPETGEATVSSATQALPSPEVFSQLCLACHKLGGKGGNVGPALDTIGQRMNHQELAVWLKDPNAVKPGTAMPNLGLSPDKIEELAGFLSQQK